MGQQEIDANLLTQAIGKAERLPVLTREQAIRVFEGVTVYIRAVGDRVREIEIAIDTVEAVLWKDGRWEALTKQIFEIYSQMPLGTALIREQRDLGQVDSFTIKLPA